jgi:hypothetical protein
MEGPHICWIILFGAAGSALIISGSFYIYESFHGTFFVSELNFIDFLFSLISNVQMNVQTLCKFTMRRCQIGLHLTTMP